jgi:cytochrome d ubiquinol oxidase subunit I
VNLAVASDTVARWQFGITTVYHYLFVPLTIALAAITAALETWYVRTGKEKYFHATKFWGKLFLINMALGVATGIVQEFQFGMNWSQYSRFVGDVFGAPLAMEALIAFFFESTFIGLWIFGWDRLPRKLHCACMWMVSLGTILSAYFILAANSWMQHPVGYSINAATGKAQLNSITDVLFQSTTIVVVLHTLTAAFLTGAALVVGISSYHLWKSRQKQDRGQQVDRKLVASMRTSLRFGLVLAVVAGIGVAFTGDSLAKVMFKQQPMKMASAEALWNSETPAPFSIFAIGDVNEGRNSVELTIPGLLSFLADGNFTSTVPGINNIAASEAAKYGGQPSDYIPNIFATFWGFRLMIGIGMTSFAAGAAGLWLTRKKRWLSPQYRTGDDEVPRLMLTRDRELGALLTKWGWRCGILTMGFPLVANSFGWIFTEMGRQPWVVFGLMKTSSAVSPNVSVTMQCIALAVFILLYSVLAVVEVKLMVRYAKAGPVTAEQPPAQDPTLRGPGPDSGGADEDADKPLAFAY